MSRPLTLTEAAGALRRGVEVEQFVSLAGDRVVYLTAGRSGQGYSLRRHVVHDEGTEEFRDISEFAPVDEDEYVGEGVTVERADDAQTLLRLAEQHGGASGRWVNQAMAADDYWTAKSAEG